jgi:serine/threonine protein kinase
VLDRGTIVAGHRIEGILGQGGMGYVYRATQLSLGREVALKFLPRDMSTDPQFRERFRREGRVQAAIDHPHIATVYEAGETDLGLFISMRLVEGTTLKHEIVSHRLTPARSIHLLAQVADALDAAHSAGLIHRDVKPQNVLIGGGDHAYLADFGLTKAYDWDSLTVTGQLVGTIDYISPELAQGRAATGASDIYALTCVLYECLTGVVPFDRPSEPAILFAHLTDPPPRLSERRPDLPAELDRVILHGMAKGAHDRPASALALIREAASALGDRGPAGG